MLSVSLIQKVSLFQDGLCPTQRAAMHGLAAAGVSAVEPLLSLLSEQRLAEDTEEVDWRALNAAVFSVSEAAVSPGSPLDTVDLVARALLDMLPAMTAAAEAEAGVVTSGDRQSGGGERPGQPLGRLLHATALQALWVLGQAVVLHLPQSLPLAEAIVRPLLLTAFCPASDQSCAQVERALLPTLLAPEPGAEKFNNTSQQPSRQNGAQPHYPRAVRVPRGARLCTAALAMVVLAPAVVGGRLRKPVLDCLTATAAEAPAGSPLGGEQGFLQEEYVAAYAGQALGRC